ncbi:MAG: polysaccharide export protein [bacterium]|nr:polysaccharide export protein [bacterium]
MTRSIIQFACISLFCLAVFLQSLQAQRAVAPPAELPPTLDDKGNPIPSNLANLPFKVINGFPEYVVGPGDVLEIISAAAGIRITESARVLPDGTVSFDVVHALPIVGLALSEAADSLSSALAVYVKSPKLQVFIKEYGSKSVSIFGSINLQVGTFSGRNLGPGIYPLKGRITAMEQIMLAGGPTADARLDAVTLIRSNRTYILNLQKAISRGDNSSNVVLEHGDVLRVTGVALADRRVTILGEVQSPGIVNLSSKSNMLEVIATARGFTTDAAANRIRIIRMSDPNNPEIITVDAELILRGDLTQNVGLEDGDIVVVPSGHMVDLANLISELQPLINFGGLITTTPLLTVSGWDINSPGGAQTVGLTTPTGAGVGVGTVSTLAQEQQVINQVQQNLRRRQKPAVSSDP